MGNKHDNDNECALGSETFTLLDCYLDQVLVAGTSEIADLLCCSSTMT